MFTYREFSAADLLDLNLVNLDEKTVSFTLEFYFRYLSEHPKYCLSVVSDENPIGYIIGNSGPYKKTKDLYSHVTALSIAPPCRRFGLGQSLLEMYDLNAKVDKSLFIDLFVRESNTQAINFYTKYGYVKHELINDYYADPSENAYDMRLYTGVDKCSRA
ncbi:N-terminal acetyltransferase B complex catalytic subunit [Nematocida minor]|uniref:N-terminal acetyltransferase B complex catalytic subunit n=1 Tax=Nematocida minor TaxID=1912983 RepID=UPI00221F5942|nr:N-terminal acetyltransferase B complex catalytic subunit [Nematocida minor]KAI5192751.1 N-terminal acetyltransferase B complex catalytic subunit [Nematocida minor]